MTFGKWLLDFFLIAAGLGALAFFGGEKLPRRWFRPDAFPYRQAAWEQNGAVYEKLGLEGGVLRSGGKIIGFSMGEMAGRDPFDVHFEKADIDINGAYPMVCRELTRMVMQNHPELLYMNREDDMGLESLRTSKLSYKPEFMVRKFTARMRDE